MANSRLFPISILFLALAVLSNAQHIHEHVDAANGFDPTMDMPMPLAVGSMLPYLHVFPGDVLWLQGWVPGTTSELFATAVALIILGVIHRWLAALRAALELAVVRSRDFDNDTNTTPDKLPLLPTLLLRGAAPFVLQHAISRGILYMVHSALGFLFMLGAMTYQVGIILAIVIGLGLGEMMYGRYTDAVGAVLHGY